MFLSSHLMSEMAVTADHLIIIGQGRVIRDVGLSEFVDESSKNIVRVRSPQAVQLRDAILGPEVRVSSHEPSVLEIDGLTAEQVGDAAATHGFVLHCAPVEKRNDVMAVSWEKGHRFYLTTVTARWCSDISKQRGRQCSFSIRTSV